MEAIAVMTDYYITADKNLDTSQHGGETNSHLSSHYALTMK